MDDEPRLTMMVAFDVGDPVVELFSIIVLPPTVNSEVVIDCAFVTNKFPVMDTLPENNPEPIT